MLCLSGFELYSRMVPLITLVLRRECYDQFLIVADSCIRAVAQNILIVSNLFRAINLMPYFNCCFAELSNRSVSDRLCTNVLWLGSKKQQQSFKL